MSAQRSFVAFLEHQLLAAGDIETVLRRVHKQSHASACGTILVFEEATGMQLDFDLRGTAEEAIARLETHPLFTPSRAEQPRRAGRGRPRLGVISREVSRLPRHWSWLEAQPGGISGALRRLVDEARRREPGKERARLAREALSRILWGLAGNLPAFEEATRALFANDQARFAELVAGWPDDLRRYALARLGQAERMQSGTSSL
jgi:hypothetical protein